MITIKSKEEIEIMAEGGKILAKIMKELEKQVRPGITTKELDRIAENLILSADKKSEIKCSFKGFNGFPACLCVSVNEQIVHAVPSDRVLKQGDIVSLDLGIFYKGFHTDMAITVPVKNPILNNKDLAVNFNLEALRLIRVTKKALKLGIKKVKPGNTLGDIGNTIQRYVESQGFNIISDLCGHGIGKKLHEEPEILNFGNRHKGEKIKAGMVFCLEPMATMGSRAIKKSEDGFGYETIDNSFSAHFEHTVAVEKNDCRILTKIVE